MNWFFRDRGANRIPQTQAVTGVSSDYCIDHDYANFPVAVAVPVGTQSATSLVSTLNEAASPNLVALGARPPPVNPEYQKRGASAYEPTRAPPLAQSVPTSTPIRETPAAIPLTSVVTTAIPFSHQQHTAALAPQASVSFERKPMRLISCPYCSTVNLKTRIETFPSWKTWVAVLVILLVFWPLAWIPLVVDCMKTTHHYCPACQALLGSAYPFDDLCVKRRR